MASVWGSVMFVSIFVISCLWMLSFASEERRYYYNDESSVKDEAGDEAIDFHLWNPHTFVKRQAKEGKPLKDIAPEKKVISKPSNNSKTAKIGKAEHPTLPPSDAVTTLFPTVDASLPANFTNDSLQFDYHHYYNSTFYLDPEKVPVFWVNLSKMPEEHVMTHAMLSDSHRRAATVVLSFDFPFYGHPLRNITIATGGFLYTGDYMHSWLAATQYIAPLMANFDTSLSNDSTIIYADNGTAFTVQWNEVVLQDRDDVGPFTFQATLLKTGDIIFCYKKIPLPVTEIKEASHPVKVGLSDAYIFDRTMFRIRRKTIYEYHRIDLKKGELGNQTAIYFTALPTCMSFPDCHSCTTANIDFDCKWCSTVERCSDGFDRGRQDWIQRSCDHSGEDKCRHDSVSHPATVVASSTMATEFHTTTTTGFSSPKQKVPLPLTQPSTKVATSTVSPSTSTISALHKSNVSRIPLLKPTYLPVDTYKSAYSNHVEHSARVEERQEASQSMGAGGVVAILLMTIVVVAVGTWILYAYKFPQTPSGQFLIKYRPSQWRWRHGEARYTAASIHM